MEQLDHESAPAPPAFDAADLQAGEEGNLSVVTASGVEDRRPDVAPLDDGYVAVWIRDAEPAADIYYSRYRDGEWSEPAPIDDTDDGDMQPRVVYDEVNDRAIAAWTRTLPEKHHERAFEATQMHYAVFEDGSWSAPVQVTDDDGFHLGVRAASRDGTTLLAWNADENGDIDESDNHIRHVRVTAEGHDDPRRLDSPSPLRDVSEGAEEPFRLAYFEAESQQRHDQGDLVVLAGEESFEEVYRYGLDGFRDLGIYRDAVGWSATRDRRTAVGFDDGSGPVVVPSRLTTTGINNLMVDGVGDDALLAYRGRPAGDRGNRLIYLLRHDGEWVYERSLNETADGEFHFADTRVAVGDDDFAAVFTGREDRNANQNTDLFATIHEFAPDLDVVAGADGDGDAAVGDEVTVNYAVRNIGDRPTDGGFEVALVADGDRVASRSHDEIAVTEEQYGEFTAEVPATGQFEVVVDPDGEVSELATRNNVSTVGYVDPDVAVTETGVTREGDRVTVTATLENVGSATATGVEATLEEPGTRDGPMGEDLETLERTGVGTIPSGETRRVEFETTLDRFQEFVRLDVRAIAPRDANAGNDVRSAPSLQPNVEVVGDRVEFSEGDGELVAEVFLVNRGEAGATFPLRVLDADEQEAARVEVSIDAPESEGELASTTVTLTMPRRLSGQTVTLLAEVTGDLDQADNAVAVDVPSIEGVDTTAPSIQEFEAELSEDNETIAVRILSGERLALDGTEVAVTGPVETTLSGEEFDRRPENYLYVAQLPVEGNGTYEFELTAAPDEAGNDGVQGQSVSVTVGEGGNDTTETDGGGLPGFGVGAALLALLVGLLALARRRTE